MPEYQGSWAAAQLALWWNEMHRKPNISCAIVLTGSVSCLYITSLLVRILFEGVILKQVNFGVVGHGFEWDIPSFLTHSEGMYDNILGFQFSLQDTQQSQQLSSAQSLNVHLLILKQNELQHNN